MPTQRFPAPTGTQIRELGVLMFGPQWKRPLAALLAEHAEVLDSQVDDRRVYGWARGEYKIPAMLGDVLDGVIAQRLIALRDMRSVLRNTP